jgi:hypothetical protein
MNYSFTATYTGLAAPGEPNYTARLIFANGLDLAWSDSNVVLDHSGVLQAGPFYVLEINTEIFTGPQTSFPENADGIFDLKRTNASTPLPSSLAILLSGLPCAWGFVRLRQRRLAVSALK